MRALELYRLPANYRPTTGQAGSPSYLPAYRPPI
jgi:hypothetical protein